MKLAVVDIGTNSVHLIVVELAADGSFRTLDKAKEMVRLGDGVFRTGRLSDDAQARAIGALARFTRLAERRGAQRVIAVATSAVREAENGGAFVQEVYERTGILPRIIAGREEARIIFRAVARNTPPTSDPLLVVDLGGGSAEFACGSTHRFEWGESRALGVQRLEPHILRDGEATPERRESLRDLVHADFASVAQAARETGAGACYVTSGSANAVLKLLRARGEAPMAEAHIPLASLEALDDELAKSDREHRAGLRGLDAARVDLIVPAVAFFRDLATALDADHLRVCDSALREGLVLDWLDRHAEDLQWEVAEPNTRRRSVMRLAERYHVPARHSRHVAMLSVHLFDLLQEEHGMDEHAREILEYAAFLHDAGHAISPRKHHKHSEYLILHGLSEGFSPEEVRMIAAIARYHRKSHPKLKHATFGGLGAPQQATVRAAAGILRVADGLDRGHAANVTDLDAEVTPQRVALTLHVEEAAELEVWGARRKAALLEEVLGRPIDFACQDPTEGEPHSWRRTEEVSS